MVWRDNCLPRALLVVLHQWRVLIDWSSPSVFLGEVFELYLSAFGATKLGPSLSINAFACISSHSVSMSGHSEFKDTYGGRDLSFQGLRFRVESRKVRSIWGEDLG